MGQVYAISAFLLWGLAPAFWKQLSYYSSIELLAHRMVWATIVMLILLLVKKRLSSWVKLVKDKWPVLILSTLLIGANWFTFVYAVNNNFILAASLGYFLNPILNVVLGVGFLKEKLTAIQWLSVFLAVIGVGFLWSEGNTGTWITLVLAGTFGFYGLLRKTAKIESDIGLFTELLFMIPVLMIYFLTLETSQIRFFNDSYYGQFMAFLAGPVTIVPLVLFVEGVKRLPYSFIGILQYIAPTSQFLLGYFLYDEFLSDTKLKAFIFIWIGVLIFITKEVFYLLNRLKEKTNEVAS